ncbi:MAG: two-component system, response regulator PdtaR [Actinomycetota bacterium]|nr:two-component system, response regulator PdtaR [Actinomycetota bacterium]
MPDVKVMVVDDTDHVRGMLVDMLELDGFDVVGQASSGREAVALSEETTPDVIIMDYKMPGMDGLTAARAIRESKPDQSIILYTAYLDPQLEQQAREAGVAMTVGKVEGLNQLERHITELCRDFRVS